MMTPAQMDQVHVALDQVAVLSYEQLVALHDAVADLPREQWAAVLGEQAPGIMAAWRSVGIDLMAGSLDSATSLGVSVPAMQAAAALPPERVQGLVQWVSENVATPAAAMAKLAGIGQKIVLEGPRSYTVKLSEDAGTTARRFAQPGACEWCRYIAVQEHRYDVYGSEWVKTNDKDRFHEHCRCVLIPAAEYIEPDYISEWDDELNAVAAQMRQKYGRRTRKGTLRGGGYGDSTWREYLSMMRKTN